MAAIGLVVAFDIPDAMLPRESPHDVGRLGIAVLPLARQAAKTFKVNVSGGAVVVSVERFGPAGKAGVRVGDIIVRVNGVDVSDGRDLAHFTLTARTGSLALVEFLRDGERHRAALTVSKPAAQRLYV